MPLYPTNTYTESDHRRIQDGIQLAVAGQLSYTLDHEGLPWRAAARAYLEAVITDLDATPEPPADWDPDYPERDAILDLSGIARSAHHGYGELAHAALTLAHTLVRYRTSPEDTTARTNAYLAATYTYTAAVAEAHAKIEQPAARS